MDTLDVARACVRRWYVFVPILALSIVGGYQLAASRSPTYAANATLTLYYPTQPAVATAPNALPPPDPRTHNPLYITGGVDLLATSLVSDMNSPEVAATLASEGHRSAISIGLDQRNGNLIDLGVTGKNSQDVLATAKSVITLADTRLTALQDRVQAPANGQYHVFVVTAPTRVAEKLPSKVKYIGAVAALGLLVGGAAALLAEGAGVRRRRSRSADNDGRPVDALLEDMEGLGVAPPSPSSHLRG